MCIRTKQLVDRRRCMWELGLAVFYNNYCKQRSQSSLSSSFSSLPNQLLIIKVMAISINLTIDSNDETKAKFIQELINECMEVLKSNPDNRCAKYCQEYLMSDEGNDLAAKDLVTFWKCVKTGIDNPDSGLG